MPETYDLIVVGGGFAGVTCAREAARDGSSVLLLEARNRLGGRTWTSTWRDQQIEYGGGWVHWHQPHTWAEITRAGLAVDVHDERATTSWWVGDERRTATASARDAIVERGWNAFLAGCDDYLPRPHDPLARVEKLSTLDALSAADRIAQLTLSDEERAVLVAEIESLASAPLDDAGAVAVARWHQLSGGSLRLTQHTGGRVTLQRGTVALLEAIHDERRVETRLSTPVTAITQASGHVVVDTASDTLRAARVVVAVPLNTLSAITFDPPLPSAKQDAIETGQASRGSKVFIEVEGATTTMNAIRAGHEFGYLASEFDRPDGRQILIGFGIDAGAIDVTDLTATQNALDRLIPGLRVVAATQHDWIADPYARGTWAIHRPGWYTHHHAAMRRPEGRLLLAGSDLANGWSGFIDGAIESGLDAGRWVRSAAGA